MAAIQHILPGRLEVLGVPWVCHIAGMGGVIHQEGHLADIVAAADTVHIPEVGLVHADQEIVFVVIPICQLPCGMAFAGDPVLSQLALCRRIDWVADLLPTGSR